MRPSGSTARLLTQPVCPSNTCAGRWPCGSHTRTVLSQAPEAMRPSGSTARVVSKPVCPVNVAKRFEDSRKLPVVGTSERSADEPAA